MTKSVNNGNFIKIDVVGSEKLQQAERMLSGIRGGVFRAAEEAVKRTEARLRKKSSSAILKHYAISGVEIRENENVTVRFDRTENGIQAWISFYGRRIPLHRFFGVTPRSPTPDTSRPTVLVDVEDTRMAWVHPGVAVDAHVIRDASPKEFFHAFVARMDSGHIGVFERTGAQTSGYREQLREFYGPAVPQMLNNEKVKEELAEDAVKGFEERFDHNVQALLNGYWS